MIAALQAEKAKITATLRVHDQLVQALRLRIAKLQKLAFGKSSEKIEREIEQLKLALEDLLVAVAEEDEAQIDEGHDEPSPEAGNAPALRRRPRVSDATLRERRELDSGTCCPGGGGDLRVVGEDVSELLDMIAARIKVVQIARIKKSCRRCEKMVQEPALSRPIPGSGVRTCWPTFWSRSSTIIFPCIASTRSLRAWGPTFPKARWSAGEGGP